MPRPSPTTTKSCATAAEALVQSLSDTGAAVFMVVAPSGRVDLAFQFSTLPPAPAVCDVAALIRARFHAELQFRKDLFGWLLVEGRVFQRYAERQPRIVLDDLGEAA